MQTVHAGAMLQAAAAATPYQGEFIGPGNKLFCVLGYGEWALAEIIPAILEIFVRVQMLKLPNMIKVVAVARSEMSQDEFHDEIRKFAVERFGLDERDFPSTQFGMFLQHVSYISFDVTKPQSWTDSPEHVSIAGYLKTLAKGMNNPSLYIIHSLAPSLMEPTVLAVEKADFIAKALARGFEKVVAFFEKPFGGNYSSAVSLREAAYRVYGKHLAVSADHYWVKYSIKNLICMILYNQLLSLCWMNTNPAKKQGVKSIVFTAEEDAVLDPDRRLPTYVTMLALKDMFQHMFSVMVKLCLPVNVLALMTKAGPDNDFEELYKREYMKVLESVVIDEEEYGQYGSGMINGRSVTAFSELKYTRRDQQIPVPNGPTWFCVKFHFTYGPMAGVPIVIQHGKALSKKDSRIEITMHPTPSAEPDQPEEMITFQLYEQTYLSDGKKGPAKKAQIKHKQAVRSSAINRELTTVETVLDLGNACSLPYTLLLAGGEAKFYNFPPIDACVEIWKLVDEMVSRYEAHPESIRLYPAGSNGPESRILRRQMLWNNTLYFELAA